MKVTDNSERVMYWGTGRRKTAVARVRLVPGDGQLVVNGKPGDLYLQFNPGYLGAAKAPLEALGLENEYNILVNVR
ncbi:30S ribosomal protein S9, partial [Haemophilus parainfluenzae]